MKLTIARSARDDLLEIRDYYQEQGLPDVGLRLVNEVLSCIERLALHPDSGRKVPEFDDDSLREIILSPFRVVYLRHPDQISLIRVWRSERVLHLPDETPEN